MKKTAENRYPNSATLFKFCKEALEMRYEGNVKVIDQDVGSILGYDPADCSHWKKGFFKNPTRWQMEGGIRPFEELFDTDRNGVVQVAEAVLAAGSFTEAPI